MKKQSKLRVLLRMIKLVKPLTGFMILAVIMGTLGFLCAQFIPILGAFAVSYGLKFNIPFDISFVFAGQIVLALLRAFLRYIEQRTNHYIAFTLLAINAIASTNNTVFIIDFNIISIFIRIKRQYFL